MANRVPTADQFAGSLLGTCLGDAAGFPVEGRRPEFCAAYVNTIMRTGTPREDGSTPFPDAIPGFFGQYSDDSQLTRELLQSYVEVGGFDPASYAGRIADIFSEERIVGRGRATEEAASRLADGVPWDRSGTPSPAAGNGSAMRAGPTGLIFHNDADRMIEAAHDQGRITHQDPRSSAGAVAIAGGVALAIREGEIDARSFASTLADWVEDFDSVIADGLREMEDWLELPLDQAVRSISTLGMAPEYIGQWAGISPFVTGSVLWSIYSFLRSPDDFWGSICTAIEVGGDVDTTAAMTGAISGARVGKSRLPSTLLGSLHDQETWREPDLTRLAGRAHQLVTSS